MWYYIRNQVTVKHNQNNGLIRKAYQDISKSAGSISENQDIRDFY